MKKGEESQDIRIREPGPMEREIRGIISERVCEYVNRTMEHMDRESLRRMAAVSCTEELLLKIFQQSIEEEAVESKHEFQQHILQGIRYKQELLLMDGGVISASKMAGLLGISRQAVDVRRRQNKLLAVSLSGGNDYYYPVWQLDGNGVRKNFEKVMAELVPIDPWSRMIFWLTGNVHLEGNRPIDLLDDESRTVWIIQAAKLTGDQGGR